MYDVIEQILAKGVEFNPKSLLAEEWPPIADCPRVIINPRYAYGQPVVGEKKIPTSALYRLWKAEGRIEKVAAWYGIKTAEAQEAIEFEVRLAA
jgi:uncharacterized protein (DUF433 family)